MPRKCTLLDRYWQLVFEWEPSFAEQAAQCSLQNFTSQSIVHAKMPSRSTHHGTGSNSAGPDGVLGPLVIVFLIGNPVISQLQRHACASALKPGAADCRPWELQHSSLHFNAKCVCDWQGRQPLTASKSSWLPLVRCMAFSASQFQLPSLYDVSAHS